MKKQTTKTIQEQWLIFFSKFKFSALCLKNTFTVLDTYKGKINRVYVCWSDLFLFYFQSLLNRLYRNATMAACILFSFGDGVLVYIIYILKFLDYCQSGPVFVIIENAWAFYKTRKKSPFSFP